MKRLREKFCEVKIGYLVTGEYGDRRKRAHWHALVFGWRPADEVLKYTSDRGDKVFESLVLSDLWGAGIVEFGEVTFESAGYCARYSAKKLYHGKDSDHDFHPISRRSTRQAIGKAWLEKYWKDCFSKGFCVVGSSDSYIRVAIPRYYEKWLMKEQPGFWRRYVTEIKPRIMAEAARREECESVEYRKEVFAASARYGRYMREMPITRRESEAIILNQKHFNNKRNLKL